MPPIPATEPVTQPATQARTFDRWGLPVIKITTNTRTGLVGLSVQARRANASEWSDGRALPDGTLTMRNEAWPDLVTAVIALDDAQALADLQTVQGLLLSLSHKLLAARGSI